MWGKNMQTPWALPKTMEKPKNKNKTNKTADPMGHLIKASRNGVCAVFFSRFWQLLPKSAKKCENVLSIALELSFCLIYSSQIINSNFQTFVRRQLCLRFSKTKAFPPALCICIAMKNKIKIELK
jgi:hypothetical protein